MYSVIMNRIRLRNGEEDEALDIYMLSFLTLISFQRYIVIAIKYATFPKVQWYAMYSKLTAKEINETLIVGAWLL